jgi:glycosyltransferase involved in cell wall biosynthesis
MNHKSIRIALVHDYLKDYGGAESVLEVLSDIYPAADIYTSIYCPSSFGPHRARLEKKWQGRVHQSFFRFFPLAHKLLSPFRFLSPLAFRLFDFSTYDLIITSATGAFFPNALNKKSAKLICYCHTPPRYLYGLVTARSLDTLFYKLVNIPLQIILHFYRLLDFTYAQNVDQFIANSSTTAARIQKFYRRDSIIINPPVEIPSLKIKNFKLKISKKVFFLTGGRLARAKRYDIAIFACNKLGLPLKIFGRSFAGYESELKNIAKNTVEFIGEISQVEKNKLFSEAKAFIYPSDNEDFGMVSVEAQSYGCPVIGYNSGGIAETVINGKTGVLFNELTVDSCVSAIKKFEKLTLRPEDCLANAQKFSKKIFVQKIRQLLKNNH